MTRQAWSELASLFTDDCRLRLDLRDGRVLEHQGPDAIAAFLTASIERFDWFAFTIVNAVTQVADASSATGRLYIRELRMADGEWSTAYGLYRDTYAKLDGRWRFAAREYASLARTDGDHMVVFPVPS